MDVKSLIPFRRAPAVSRRDQPVDPFVALRDEMNRTFEDFFAGFPFFPAQPAGTGMLMVMPQMDVSETDKDIRLTVELPGLSADDIDIALEDEVLTIRGKKTAERQEDERDYHVMERAQGTFSRSIRLPFEVDPGQVQAAYKDGVLTIAIPKPAQAQAKTRRIEVQREDKAADGKMSGIDRTAAGDKPSTGDKPAASEKSATGGESSGAANQTAAR